MNLKVQKLFTDLLSLYLGGDGPRPQRGGGPLLGGLLRGGLGTMRGANTGCAVIS